MAREAVPPTQAQAIPIEADPRVGLAIGPSPEFQVELPVFEGPLPLLLHLIESAELDILSVPLAKVADAYVAFVATHPVDAANLAHFVSTAAQLILIKSRSLLPAEPSGREVAGDEDIDEEDLRRRLIAYRAIATRLATSPRWISWRRCGTASHASRISPRRRWLRSIRWRCQTPWPGWPRSRNRSPRHRRSCRARSPSANRSACCARPWARPDCRLCIHPGRRHVRTERVVSHARAELVRRRELRAGKRLSSADRARNDAEAKVRHDPMVAAMEAILSCRQSLGTAEMAELAEITPRGADEALNGLVRRCPSAGCACSGSTGLEADPAPEVSIGSGVSSGPRAASARPPSRRWPWWPISDR